VLRWNEMIKVVVESDAYGSSVHHQPDALSTNADSDGHGLGRGARWVLQRTKKKNHEGRDDLNRPSFCPTTHRLEFHPKECVLGTFARATSVGVPGRRASLRIAWTLDRVSIALNFSGSSRCSSSPFHERGP